MVNRSMCLVLFVVMYSLAGCSSIKTAPNLSEMTVKMHWTPRSGCSAVSPPIEVSGVPAEATTLKIEMHDEDAPNYNHGGGEVAAKAGVTNISEAALKNYSGPCPPTGSHTYRLDVYAINADHSFVLAKGTTRLKFPN